MNSPDSDIWKRLEKLGKEFDGLAPDQASLRLSQLAADGETRSVLTLLSAWCDLPPARVALTPGTTLSGRYQLIEKIGEGGMGAVWRAHQRMIDRQVAVKLIHPTLVTPELRERFLKEMHVLGKLDHPHIVRIYDADIETLPDGSSLPFYAMELVEGMRLGTWAEQHRQDLVLLLRLMASICASVRFAHEQGIVHRDLKPSNILVRPNGEAVVLDFGIARIAGIVVGEKPGAFSGTLPYAAPEQLLATDRDFRSGESVDIYAVGAILFEVLTGHRLFEFKSGTPFAEKFQIILNEPARRLSSLLPDCPSLLEEIVSRALRRNPADRYYSIGGLGRALAHMASALSHPSMLATPPWSPSVGAIIPGTNWKLTAKIGEGGAGQVWTGHHQQLDEKRVFKFCDSEQKVRALKRELTLFRLLKERIGRNSHFIPLHEVSLDEPPWYLMMDFTDARDLEAWCADYPGGINQIPEATRLEVVAQVAEALQAAHEAGILHRDIKPANLLVRSSEENSKIHVLVADFGIGQIVADELLSLGTMQGFTGTLMNEGRGSISGTILYLAPEVLEGNPATSRSDIYSLGVVLWQLLIGHLHAALDPTDWQSHIADPLLREDLSRCLAGDPNKRWASAGELAARLRTLGDRRLMEHRRQEEIAKRERAAFRRGALRTGLIAGIVLTAVIGLAWLAWTQRRAAEEAQGEIALKQASVLRQVDFLSGRRERGMRLLETAAKTVTDRTTLRSVTAEVMGMSDLVRVTATGDTPGPSSSLFEAIPTQSNETCRVFSPNGKLMARARALDGLNGAIDLIETATAKTRLTITRGEFPWMPVAAPGMLRFSPDNKLLAVGGAATSRHILIFEVTNGSLQTYAYHGSDPLSMAWHPSNRLIAVGGEDEVVRVWDLAAARDVTHHTPTGNQFDVPPNLGIPALDTPIHYLRGYRGPVLYLAFSTNGQWLASLDAAGYVRVHTGFSRDGLPDLPNIERAGKSSPSFNLATPPLAVELRLESMEEITDLSATQDHLIIHREHGSTETFQFLPSTLPTELHVAPGVTDLAWNGDASELCVVTFTDAHWIRVHPLEVFFSALGKNPVGVGWPSSDGFWAMPQHDRYIESRPVRQGDGWELQYGKSHPIEETEKGQGARTSMASSSLGRIAVYRGRRIQFFANHEAAGSDSSLIAHGAEGVFRGIFWDKAGQLLGAVFESGQARLRLESWKTTTNFPPVCQSLPPLRLEAAFVVPANDGRHCLVRGGGPGLQRLDPETGSLEVLTDSSAARQSAPLACSADGKWLSIVVDRAKVRLLAMPRGEVYADLPNPRSAGLVALAWDDSGRHLVGLTEDGAVQIWNMTPWLQWLDHHGLAQTKSMTKNKKMSLKSVALRLNQ